MTAELAKDGGDVKATWARLKDADLQITDWRGNSAFVFAPTGAATSDYIRIALGREIAWCAGPIVNPNYRPWGEDEFSIPAGPGDRPLPDTARLAGPVYRLLDRAGGAFVHVRSFLGRCGRVEREKREAMRPEMERRVVRETGPAPRARLPSWTWRRTISSSCRASCASSRTGRPRVRDRSASSRIGRSTPATTPIKASAKLASSRGR
jgi:hypothetical protein